MGMTKADMVSAFAEAADMTKVKAAECLRKLAAIMAEELVHSGKVPLPYMGKLTVVERAERAGRNPRTGETVRIQAKKAVKFKPGKRLKSSVH